jgi:hypothetical protein
MGELTGKIRGYQSHAEEIVDHLFPSNPLLCIGAAKDKPETNTRENFRGRLSSLSLIVPSAMRAEAGTNQEGRPSVRCNDNVGPRQYLIVEFDNGSIDEQAAIIWHLSKYGPLVLVLHSGGKSLHSWFYCQHEDEGPGSRLRRFMEYAVLLGGDPHTWVPCQFVRIPDGTRENGKRQSAIYLDPGVIR